MSHKFHVLFVGCILMMSSIANAQEETIQASPDAPTAKEVLKVLSYYSDGKASGPILLDFKPCLTVDKKKGSPTINECTEPVSGKVAKGAAVYAWTKWFVPKDGKYEDIMVQWIHNGTVYTTTDVALTTSAMTGTRHFSQKALSKPGNWEIKILRDGKELARAEIEVE